MFKFRFLNKSFRKREKTNDDYKKTNECKKKKNVFRGERAENEQGTCNFFFLLGNRLKTVTFSLANWSAAALVLLSSL